MAAQVDPKEQPLAAYLLAQLEAALTHLDEVPREQAIHRSRVAVRRLRSTLRVFGSLLELDEAQGAEVDDELRWLADLLGEVRDRQVQRGRFIAVLADLDAEDVAPEAVVRVAVLIETALLAEERSAAHELEETLASPRYRALHAMLERWRAEPPVAIAASAKAHRRAVRTAAKQAAHKADKRLARSVGGGDDAALHRARKAIRRARYAAEVLLLLGRGKSRRRRYKQLQDVLGDFQDAVVAQETTHRLAELIDDAECGFVLGLLYAQASDHADDVRRRAHTLIA